MTHKRSGAFARLIAAVCAPAVFVAAVALSAAGTALAQPVTYTLQPDLSQVTFEVLHFGTSTSRGRFAAVQGTVTLDRQAKRGEVSLRIPTASVDTGLRIFDARLRQADLLGTEQHPEAFFVATQFRFEGQALAEVRGEFTLRGQSQPLSLRALRFVCRPIENLATEVCGGDFEAEFKRSDFGATFGLPFVSDRVRLLIQVEAQALAPTASR